MVKNKYGVVPGHDFSQMQDLLDILEIALKKVNYTGDLAKDRNAVRDAIASTKDFKGLASGPINFCATGTPECRDGNRTPVMIEYTRGGKNFKTKVAGKVTFNPRDGL